MTSVEGTVGTGTGDWGTRFPLDAKSNVAVLLLDVKMRIPFVSSVSNSQLSSEVPMRKLTVFNSVSLDGYFTDANNDVSWAHSQNDSEFDEFVQKNAQGGDTLLLGRVTYDMMSAWWPTVAAKQQMPKVADGMNKMKKIVFSRSLTNPTWENTTVVKGDLAAEARKLKKQPGGDITILGSGSIVAELARAGVIDAYSVVIVPIVLGKGRTMFEGANAKLRLTNSRAFKGGKVLLTYEPG